MTIAATYTSFKGDLKETEPYQQTLEVKWTLFVHDHKVALVSSTLYSGINRYSQKRWFRWNTNSSTGFYRTNRNLIVPFSITKNKGKCRPSMLNPFDLLRNSNARLSNEFSDAVKSKLNVTEEKDVYPMLDHFGFQYQYIPKGMKYAFRADNGRDFAAALFGKSNVRKDLIRESCNAHPNDLCLVKEFRNLVPVDWIINFLRQQNNVPYRIPRNNLRKILQSIDPRSLRYLLHDNDDQRMRWAADVARSDVVLNNNVYVRSWHALHDEIWQNPWPAIRQQYVAPPPPKNRKITLVPLAEKLDDLIVDDLVFKPAKDTDTMQQWSDYMSNCIRGYADQAVHGYGVYAAVERDGEVIANLEIVNDNLKQLLGKYNQVLDKDVRNKIVSTLEKVGVNTSEDWWGSEREAW